MSAVERLAAALEDDPDEVDYANTEAIVREHPTIAADLDFGAAWRRVEAALPDQYQGEIGFYQYPIVGGGLAFVVHAEWFTEPPPNRVRRVRHWYSGEGPTPTEALVALAEALEARL